jgi:predicted RNA-binding protein with PUA-like domain
MPRGYWLLKSEPDVYSIDALKQDGRTGWGGVRNYQARNFMRDTMREGDLVLFYHSNAEPPGVAGVAKVAGPPEPDPTQFDKQSEYYDAGSTKAEPRWVQVPVGFVEKFKAVVPLETLKADPKLAGMAVLQRGQRLSVQPVSPEHFARVLALAGAKTKP